MGLRGKGVLGIWHTIAPEGESEYWRWHNVEHIPERVGVPGFLRGRRFRSAARPLEYVDFYETESVETIRSAPYLARLNDPTPWTRRVVPHFRDTLRLGFRIARSLGRGQGGVMLTARLQPAEARPGALSAWLAGPGVAGLAEPAGVVGVHVLETVAEVTSIPTEEKRIRVQESGDIVGPAEPWVLLVEANDVDVLRALTSGPLTHEALASEGAGGAVIGTYRLQVSIDPEP